MSIPHDMEMKGHLNRLKGRSTDDGILYTTAVSCLERLLYSRYFLTTLSWILDLLFETTAFCPQNDNLLLNYY